MADLWQAGKDFFGDLVYDAAEGLCNFLWDVSDKIDDFTANVEIDESAFEIPPRRFVEKKRKTIPSGGIFDACPLKNIRLTENRIKVHQILDGFDEALMQSAKKRILEACAFIFGNTETEIEKHTAMELARMLWKGAVIITDVDLVLDKKIAGCFYTKDGIPYIGLDIAELQKTDDASLIQNLVHESYHAWRYFTSNTEYSIVDETKAWNTGLCFSNKYRNMYGLPIEREKEYSESELMKHTEYFMNANVNIRFGPGENIIEKIGYGIANLLEDATDAVNRATEKIMDKTLQTLDR